MLQSWMHSFRGNKVEEDNIFAAKQQRSPVVEIPVLKNLTMLKRKRTEGGDSLEVRIPSKRQIPEAGQSQPSISTATSQMKRNKTIKQQEDEQTSSVKREQSARPPSSANESDIADRMAPLDNSRAGQFNDFLVRAREALAQRDPDEIKDSLLSHINYDMLEKHNELRLIDQEIAKCQVALEQLRRCREIPYPAITGTAHDVVNVMTGIGPSVAKTSGNQPQLPAPRGVADGPYTRHYARWLLPDSRFDGTSAIDDPISPKMGGKAPAKSRSTRGSFVDATSTASKRSQRGSASQSLQALPSGYANPKDKTGPTILKRQSDNVWVKLVCVDCGRGDFSSAQGFINHCRIAHARSYATHEVAAQNCGHPIPVDESGQPIGTHEPPSAPAPVNNTTGASLINPLIRSAHLLKDPENSLATIKKRKRSNSAHQNMPESLKRSLTSTPTLVRGEWRRSSMRAPLNPSFIPSEKTPHLSEMMKLKGSGIDLKSLVDEITQPVVFEESSADEDETESTEGSEGKTRGISNRLNRDKPSNQMRRPVSSSGPNPAGGTATNNAPTNQGARTAPRPSSSKGQSRQPNTTTKPHYLQKSRQPYSSPYANQQNSILQTRGNSTQTNDAAHNGIGDLSPTNESNPAPSLTTDDGEDEAEEEEADQESVTTSSKADDENIEIEVEEDGEAKEPVDEKKKGRAGPKRKRAGTVVEGVQDRNKVKFTGASGKVGKGKGGRRVKK
ncbi:MAG: hypothetical protein M1834_002058 [Cirrosporium novae-zelandiae]|nr:MAG: hypothetical protein M1834_002058 [Cirrosporium novae-zelandiae]